MQEPGWYDDPSGDPGSLRFWDGSNWSERTARAADLLPAPTGPPRVPRPTPPVAAVPVLGLAPPSVSGGADGGQHAPGTSAVGLPASAHAGGSGWNLLLVGALVGLVWPLFDALAARLRSYRDFGLDTPATFDPDLAAGSLFGELYWYVTLGGLAFAALMVVVLVLSLRRAVVGAYLALAGAGISLVLALLGLVDRQYDLLLLAVSLGRYVAVAALLGAGGSIVLRSLSSASAGSRTATPAGSMPQAPVDGLTITALILSLLGFFMCLPLAIVGLVLGHISRARIRGSAGSLGGAGMAVAAIVLGWCAVGTWAVAAAVLVAVSGSY